MTITHANDARVVVYVRQNCHLCDIALELIADVCKPASIEWVAVDIDLDEDLYSRFTDLVPVTFVDGQQHDHYGVNPTRLSAALGL